MVFYTYMRGPIDISSDPYFQYTPHRLIFPAVFVVLVWFYLTAKDMMHRNILYFIITLISAISVLWNPDTGLMVIITWGYHPLLCGDAFAWK